DSKKKPLVINFDAHLDVRPLDRGLSSGTPFFRLLEDFSDFDFLEVGVQSHCNSLHHKKWAKDKGAHILEFEDLLYSGQSQTVGVLKFIEPFIQNSRPTYLSIDIDGFSNAYAPGCSQAWATGFHPEDFFQIL